MSAPIQESIEDVVLRIKSNGTLLDVKKVAKRVAAQHGCSGEDIGDEIALALVEAAARRGVPMQFQRDLA